MDERIKDLYHLPDIGKYEDINLLTLSNECAVLEEGVFSIANALPEKERGIIEAYISARNDLEFETYKTALRWGKQHYK